MKLSFQIFAQALISFLFVIGSSRNIAFAKYPERPDCPHKISSLFAAGSHSSASDPTPSLLIEYIHRLFQEIERIGLSPHSLEALANSPLKAQVTGLDSSQGILINDPLKMIQKFVQEKFPHLGTLFEEQVRHRIAQYKPKSSRAQQDAATLTRSRAKTFTIMGFKVDAFATSAAFHPKGHEIAVGTEAGNLLFYSLDGRRLNKRAVTENIADVQYSFDGKHILSTGAGGTRIWPTILPPLSEACSSPIFCRPSTSVSKWSPNGNLIAIGGLPPTRGKAAVHLISASGEPLVENHGSGLQDISRILFSSNNRLLILANRFRHSVHEITRSGEALELHHREPILDSKSHDSILGPDGTSILFADPEGAIRWINLEGNDLIDPILAFDENSPAWKLALSPHGKILAASTGGGLIKIFDLLTGDLLMQAPSANSLLHSLEFSSDGNYLMYLTDDGKIRLIPVPSF